MLPTWAVAHLRTKLHLDHPALRPQQTWAENYGSVPLVGGELGPNLTLWPGPRPTSVPSSVLIHPAVWPQ